MSVYSLSLTGVFVCDVCISDAVGDIATRQHSGED